MWRSALLTLVLAGFCSWLWAESLLLSQNSLYTNDNWIVQKRMMGVCLMGADEFLLTRAPLGGETLNLGAYYGYQQVLSRARYNPRQVSFRFKVPSGSYLDFSFGHDGGTFDGVMLSREAQNASIFYNGDENGAFAARTEMRPILFTDAWHEAKIEFGTAGAKTFIDGVELRALSGDSPQSSGGGAAGFHAGAIGFRSGAAGALVDDIAIEDQTGVQFMETFRNEKNWLAACLSSFALWLAITGACAALVRARDMKTALLTALTVSLTGSAVGGIWYLFDFNFWSRLPSLALMHTQAGEARAIPAERFEHLRLAFFDGWASLTGTPTRNMTGLASRLYPSDSHCDQPVYCGPSTGDVCRDLPAGTGARDWTKPKTGKRILFVGTSQTMGAGARRLEDTFFVRAHDYLKKSVPAIQPLEAMNISVSGSDSTRMLKTWRERFADFSPLDLVVINLASNDAVDSYIEEMSHLIEFAQKNSDHVVLLQEPNATGSKGLFAKYEMLNSLSEKYHVPVFRLNDYLSSPEAQRSGVIWWDIVHMTSHGQELTANWLAPQIAPFLTSGKTRTALGRTSL